MVGVTSRAVEHVCAERVTRLRRENSGMYQKKPYVNRKYQLVSRDVVRRFWLLFYAGQMNILNNL
jgi:hypothetical protein